MATSTELLRAAEHMRKLSAVQRDMGLPVMADTAHRAADALEREAMRLRTVEAAERNNGRCSGLLAYENIHGKPVHRDGWYRFRCMSCGRQGDTTSLREHCDAKVTP